MSLLRNRHVSRAYLSHNRLIAEFDEAATLDLTFSFP